MNFVYAKRLRGVNYKEDCTWACADEREALRLCKWLEHLGINAQRIDQEVYDAMPDHD